MTEEQRRYLCAWQKKCYEAGLVGCDYPKEYGGGGHKGFQRIASQEMARAGVPYMINVIGLSMAAPTILNHGTEEQKRRFLPPLLLRRRDLVPGLLRAERRQRPRERAGRRPCATATTGSSTATRCGPASRTSRAG